MSLNRSWRAELTVLAAGGVALVLLGLWYEHLALALLTGVTSYLAWHLVQLYRLYHWLTHGCVTPPPDAKGIWAALLGELWRGQRRTRKRKRKLRRALKRFKESTAALPEATVVLGLYGEIEWWNAAAERLLGLRRPDDRGQRIANLIRHPEFVRRLESGDWRQPLVISSPVDANIWLTLNLVPTAKHKYLLLAQNTTRLQHLDQVRRDFVANVSHELRTPLTVISGYVEALLDHPEARKPPWKHVLPQVHEQARRMRGIVEDLLLLSRLELDRELTSEEEIAVATLLREIHKEAMELSGEARHRILLDVDPQLGLRGNRNELRSAFSNLVVNAIRYTPTDGEIRLRWHADTQGAHFSVADTGVGIEARHIPRLTERFYRVDVGRSRETGGTGLGLAIVKHVVTRHGGELTIESTVGEGSTFTCHFPVRHFYWLEIEPRLEPEPFSQLATTHDQ
ncbi:MAG: phosphate regulon sensor histidine kinase PhoR [Gammaproteobacteria bacterium]